MFSVIFCLWFNKACDHLLLELETIKKKKKKRQKAETVPVGINACWHTQWNSCLYAPKFPDETSLLVPNPVVLDDVV